MVVSGRAGWDHAEPKKGLCVQALNFSQDDRGTVQTLYLILFIHLIFPSKCSPMFSGSCATDTGIPALSLTSFVTLDKAFAFPEPLPLPL